MQSQCDFDDIGLSARQDREVRAVLAQWEGERRRLARERMQLAAKAGHERRLIQGPDGDGGEVKMMVDPASYHYWGQRLGYECWGDAEFCREYLRDNPEARVKSRPDHPTLVVHGLGSLAASGAKKFSKVYGSTPATTQTTTNH